MLNGIINIYKDPGFTSFDVVAKLRGILHIKKIGHTGTLDPDATGVLPVAVGNATKVCDLLTDHDKEYLAKLRLGVETDTYDMSGTVTGGDPDRASSLKDEAVKEAVLSFLGDSMQVPPMYSALKVQGKRLYELARAGQTVERKARPVNISALEILEYHNPGYSIRINCSKGTYIRSLCHDIGEKLGCGGCMESLVRTRVGDFKIEDAVSLRDVEKIMKEEGEEGLKKILLSTDLVFRDYAAVTVRGSFDRLLKNGNKLPPRAFREKPGESKVRVYDEDGIFTGIYEKESRGEDFRPVKLFLS